MRGGSKNIAQDAVAGSLGIGRGRFETCPYVCLDGLVKVRFKRGCGTR